MTLTKPQILLRFGVVLTRIIHEGNERFVFKAVFGGLAGGEGGRDQAGRALKQDYPAKTLIDAASGLVLGALLLAQS